MNSGKDLKSYSWGFWGALFLTALLLIFGLFPWFQSVNSHGDIAWRLQSPSARFWMGTDAFGRDVWYQCVLGLKYLGPVST